MDSCETCFGSAIAPPHRPSNYDEFFMHHTLLFAHSLKDLQNLRQQLHSAADYFEASYDRDDHKQLVLETLNDYLKKALVNTVDHLGSVASKIDNFLDQKFGQVSHTSSRLFCVEQRVRIWQEVINSGGMSQQSMVMTTPKYHKRYILPGEKSGTALTGGGKQPPPPPAPFYRGNSSIKRHTSGEALSSTPETFLFARVASGKEQGKRALSPLLRFPLVRSGSLVAHTSMTPGGKQIRFPSEPQRSISMFIHPEREQTKETQRQRSLKNKRLFKVLLGPYRATHQQRQHKSEIPL